MTAHDLVFSDRFSRHEPGILEPLRAALLTSGDFYLRLADRNAYLHARRRPEDFRYANTDHPEEEDS